jgi:hypothetical protein
MGQISRITKLSELGLFNDFFFIKKNIFCFYLFDNKKEKKSAIVKLWPPYELDGTWEP